MPAYPVVRLAVQIAERIKGWLDGKTRLPGKHHPIRPGDIMVLTPRREPFAGAGNSRDLAGLRGRFVTAARLPGAVTGAAPRLRSETISVSWLRCPGGSSTAGRPPPFVSTFTPVWYCGALTYAQTELLPGPRSMRVVSSRWALALPATGEKVSLTLRESGAE